MKHRHYTEQNLSSSNGFTLLELIIVVTIIGLIVTIAYPVYTNHMTTARRAEGKTALLDLQVLMEQYFSTHNSYATATIATDPITDVLSTANTAHDWYRLQITNQTATTYTLTATPNDEQTDALCGTLSVDQLGNKANTGTGTIQQCWG